LADRVPGLTPEVDQVFAKVLAKKKRDRYGRATQFAEALETALGRRDRSEAGADLRSLSYDPDTGQYLLVTGAGSTSQQLAPDTELDQSTRAQELAEAVPPLPPTLPPVPPVPSVVEPGEAISVATGELASRRAHWPWVLAMMLAGAVSGALYLRLQHRAPPIVVSSRSGPPPVATPAKPPLEFAPDPIEPHDDVQFTFHVFPKSALVTVDDRRVPGRSISLPWQKAPRHVRLTAPGFEPISTMVPSTQSRTFEMHMQRVQPMPVPHKPSHPEKIHDAAPVQEL
jgi:hypothetical protein